MYTVQICIYIYIDTSHIAAPIKTEKEDEGKETEP